MLNSSPAVLKLLYKKYNDNIDVECSKLFGYGVTDSYNGLPYFSGGVGVNCHENNLKSVGYNMSKTASGKTFDVYSISKIEE